MSLSKKNLKDAADCMHKFCDECSMPHRIQRRCMKAVSETALAYRDMLKKLLQLTEGFDYRANNKFTMSDCIGLETEIKKLLGEE